MDIHFSSSAGIPEVPNNVSGILKKQFIKTNSARPASGTSAPTTVLGSEHKGIILDSYNSPPIFPHSRFIISLIRRTSYKILCSKQEGDEILWVPKSHLC